MSDRHCTIEHVWNDLAKLFPEENLTLYRELCTHPADGFTIARKNFSAEVAGMSGSGGDIHQDRAKRRQILGHVLLGVFDALRRGKTDFIPVPRVLGQPWAMQETALLMWSSLHGTSDDRISGTPRN